MGKKTKPAAGGKKESVEVDKDDRKLQAILLADSFTKTFRYKFQISHSMHIIYAYFFCKLRPITWENPKVLVPLVNVPMLDYTIEFLSQNGVEEVSAF